LGQLVSFHWGFSGSIVDVESAFPLKLQETHSSLKVLVPSSTDEISRSRGRIFYCSGWDDWRTVVFVVLGVKDVGK
jgi:hypothetical protein